MACAALASLGHDNDENKQRIDELARADAGVVARGVGADAGGGAGGATGVAVVEARGVDYLAETLCAGTVVKSGETG